MRFASASPGADAPDPDGEVRPMCPLVNLQVMAPRGALGRAGAGTCVQALMKQEKDR